MFELDLGQIDRIVSSFLWPFFRVASFFMVIPMIGSRLVPVRIRLGLALVVSFLIVPLLPDMPVYDGLAFETVKIIAQQILIGSLMGFLVQVLFQVFVLGAQLTAMQMGLGFASTSDPANGVSVVILGQYYLMIVMMFFLATNGHLIMIELLVKSFTLVPVGGANMVIDSYWKMALAGSWMFSGALMIALPAVTALLVVNFAFGVMTRAAPQLNIFAIGFPFTMLMGLLIAWISMGDLLGHYFKMTEFALDYLLDMIVAESR
ncbi:flagellar type III secretion system protein FliR [Pontibacterium sp. N1Y112]|uniref:Flagellar biosynthetic protein FliR n=1 Tax=Pontibacterium sinense TaxID=2781979 RepID=A0A8J7FAE5_9GAMM|nr:flagellar type III secretion system protein FliR [Pontibacterium sinense]